jgi:hypothetical protein
MILNLSYEGQKTIVRRIYSNVEMAHLFQMQETPSATLSDVS